MASVTIIENTNVEGIDRIRVHGSHCRDIAKDRIGRDVWVTELDAASKGDVIERIAEDNCEEAEFVQARFLPCCGL